jgi:autophagy-related protein 5
MVPTLIQSSSKISAYRMSYLPLLLPRLLAFFRRGLVDQQVKPEDGWFSFEDVTLKWHHPIGLLFDLYSGYKEALVEDLHGKQEASATAAASTLVTPLWRITLHFSKWPAEQLVKLDGPGKVLADAFNNSLKEVSV